MRQPCFSAKNVGQVFNLSIRSQSERTTLRRGLSLLEVILAIAIFGTSLAVIGELVRIGSNSAAAARDLSDGQRLCSNLMNEIAAGVLPPTAVSQTSCTEDATWLYSVAADTTEIEGLLAVTVTVEQDPQFYSRPHTVTLVRWVVDPASLETETTEEGTGTSTTGGPSAP
jgi:prepilin-type N-terminal cleavage/methylation domain-containing protein